jgi:hypothetical protein
MTGWSAWHLTQQLTPRPRCTCCAESKEEQDREQRILKILEEFRLQGGAYHTDMVMAKTGDRLLGALAIARSHVLLWLVSLMSALLCCGVVWVWVWSWLCAWCCRWNGRRRCTQGCVVPSQ